MHDHRAPARYEGKVAFVSGGTAGIGKAVVAGLAAERCKVVFTGLSPERGLAYESELLDAGFEVAFRNSDATLESAVAADIAFTVERFGRLDIAINNVGNLGAGDTADMLLHECDLSAWQATTDLNLTACFLGMKHQIRQMLAQGGGVIANTGSVGGLRVCDQGSPAYSAAKAGLVHLTEFVAVRYARHNIRANVVSPGFTATETLLEAVPLEVCEEMAARMQPIGRMLTTQEVAEAFLWVCSDQARIVTGLVLSVDGGWAAS
jgi:NAD(P)-dependent dehydrogenase (short-subunit alcohol dehydrogenase family)